jgi:hypothetical protein
MMKYLKYLPLKHSYEGINCISLLEFIYRSENHDLTLFGKIWKDFGLENGKVRNAKWTVDPALLECWLCQNALKIELTELKEFDLLIFKNLRTGKISHFGMYIGDNRFIHLPESGYVQIEDYNQKWREVTYGAYRHLQKI